MAASRAKNSFPEAVPSCDAHVTAGDLLYFPTARIARKANYKNVLRQIERETKNPFDDGVKAIAGFFDGESAHIGGHTAAEIDPKVNIYQTSNATVINCPWDWQSPIAFIAFRILMKEIDESSEFISYRYRARAFRPQFYIRPKHGRRPSGGPFQFFIYENPPVLQRAEKIDCLELVLNELISSQFLKTLHFKVAENDARPAELDHG